MKESDKVLCVGDLILDHYVHGNIDRISPEAPIPILKANDRNYNILGGCGNVARNICSANNKCHLISIVGNDDDGLKLKDIMKKIKNLTSSIIVDPDRCTTKKTRYVCENQQILRVDKEMENPISSAIELKIIKLLKKKINDCNVIVLSDYNKGVLTNNIIKKIIKISRDYKKILIVDPKKKDFSVYAGATFITPNLKELKEATNTIGISTKNNEDNLVLKLSKKIIDKFDFKAVITTRSSNGISVVTDVGRFFHLPSEAKEVFDVSGAGDTVLAYLSSSISKGHSLESSIKTSNVAAGLAVAKFGTSVVSMDEIDNIKQIKNNKLITTQDISKILKDYDSEKIIGFTNGCFDLLHTGHISYLKSAKQKCDILILGLNSDESIKKLKGKNRPIVELKDRVEILSSFPFVDKIVVFEEVTPIKLIKKIKPNVIFKGKDYQKKDVVGFYESKKWHGRVILIDFIENKSTTNIIERIKTSVT
ncbi:MAG: bifunctional heptose 7-phosphate kinase/heptose 1-phosphate adenyltransferase [Alphaproteobacteria bacterium]